MRSTIHVIGGGLAGPEAAFQAARLGRPVRLYEMRPGRRTPAHETNHFGELVCSNSLKTETPNSAPWLLKEELRRMGSVCLDAAASQPCSREATRLLLTANSSRKR